MQSLYKTCGIETAYYNHSHFLQCILTWVCDIYANSNSAIQLKILVT